MMDHQQIATESELEAGQTPEAMAGNASKQIDKGESQKPIHSRDGSISDKQDQESSLENTVDDSQNIISH